MNIGAEALEARTEHAHGEHDRKDPSTQALRSGRARRLGEVRIPLTPSHRTRATAWRLPDGRTVWCVRVWEVDRPVTRVVGTAALARYCRRSRLGPLAEEIERIGAP